MSQKRDNTGVLFPEKEKRKPASPDYTGNATIGGVDYRMAAWVKESSKQMRTNPATGKKEPAKFFSFSFTRVDQIKSKPTEEPCR